MTGAPVHSIPRATGQFATLRWLLIPAIALHNFEEWLTFPIYGETGAVIAAKLGIPRPETSWPALQFGLVLVTVLPALAIIFGARRNERWGDWLVCATGSIFLANVFLPHLPAALIVGGYTPGLLTALLVNLPLVSLLLMAADREGRLSRLQIFLAIVVGVILLPLALFSVLAIGQRLFP